MPRRKQPAKKAAESTTVLYKAGDAATRSTVSLVHRAGRRSYELRWWDPALRDGRGNYRYTRLGHMRREDGERAAQDAAKLLATTGSSDPNRPRTPVEIFARYLEQQYPTDADAERVKEVAPKTEADERRAVDLWLAFFAVDRPAAKAPSPGVTRDLRKLDGATIHRYVAARKAGRIEVQGRQVGRMPRRVAEGEEAPRRTCSDTTAWNDVRFLKAVLTWATTYVDEDGVRLLETNPIAGVKTRKNRNPVREKLTATYDRYQRLREHCDQLGDGYFGYFMDFVEATGHRVSQICALRVSDRRRQPDADAPFGRVRTRPDASKARWDTWDPVSEEAARAIDAAIARRGAIGDVYIFQAPGARGRAADAAGQPWSKWHVRDLLQRAEAAAGLDVRGRFHEYRRKRNQELERAGVPRAVRQRLMQWKTPAMLDLYDAGSAQEIAAAVGAEIPKLRGDA
jgi:hypothetical protein